MKNIEKLFISKFATQKEKTVAMTTPPVSVTKPAPVQKKPNTDGQRQRRVAQIEQPPEPTQEPPPAIPIQEPKKQTGKEYLRSVLTDAASERLGLDPQTVKTIGNTLYRQRLDLPFSGGMFSAGMMDDFGPGGAGLKWTKDF